MDEVWNVITNSHCEYLVYIASRGDNPRWHERVKFAKRYPTLRGCRCAATKFAKRWTGATFTARQVTLELVVR
jgi:hypothetical protein